MLNKMITSLKVERPKNLKNCMKKLAYLDCINGISGDMFLGAMLDAGLPRRSLDQMIRSLGIPGIRLEVRSESRKGIQGKRAVIHDKTKKTERHLSDILRLIKKAKVAPAVFKNARSIFELLAKAEAKVHGTSIGDVHFHEVGAIDSIVDILGACVAMDEMGIQKLYVSEIPLGSGIQKTEHGAWPMPGAATLELLKGIPVIQDGRQGELTTPTGAALVRHFASGFGKMPVMRVSSVGYGCGSRDDAERPNVARIIIGEEASKECSDQVLLIETNIDDMNPQYFSYVLDRLFEAGALDVYLTPIHMKELRAGVVLSVMAKPEDQEVMADIIFQETTSIGVRTQVLDRMKLERKIISVMIGKSKIPVKVSFHHGKPITFSPEFQDVQRLAKKTGRSLKDLSFEAVQRAKNSINQ